jgi:predicted TIM-barrel fold metal-dependent hydrolase
MKDNAPAPPPTGIIDVQSHLYVPAVLDRLAGASGEVRVYRTNGDRFVQMGPWHRRVMPNHCDPAAAVRAMDAHGIALTLLSINDPGPEWFGEAAPEVARMCNDFIAGAVRAFPGRFAGLAVLPLPDIPAALAELDRCVSELGFKGVLVYTNIAGRFLDEPHFRPLFARAVELDLPVVLHPARPASTGGLADCEMIAGLGNMFEDTIALCRLILAGVLEDFPTLKLVCPHLGGALPFLIGRVDHQVRVLKRGPRVLPMAPSEYLRRVYFDVASPLPAAIRFAHEFLGAGRLLFASDSPWVSPAAILEALHGAGLPAADQPLILHENARRLFKLP